MILMLKGYFVVANSFQKRRWARPSRLAGVLAPGVRGHDVCRHLGRQRHAHRCVGQHCQRGDLRRQRKTGNVYEFMRYGVPLTLCQLAVSAAYVTALFFWVAQ